MAAAYENIIRKFIFEVVEKTITENKLTPKQIHNIDESPFYWDMTQKRVLAIKDREIYQTTSNKKHLTIVSCITASGDAMNLY